MHHCPKKAIFTALSDENRNERYINENIKVIDIIETNRQID